MGFIKFQRKSNTGRAEKMFRNEVETLKGLDHPNIVRPLNYDLEADRPYMITELCKGGDLQRADLSSWGIHEKQQCFHQICDTFSYLWNNGLSKSDHNFKNIFLKEDGRTLVIGYFETARAIERNAEGVKDILHNMQVHVLGTNGGEKV